MVRGILILSALLLMGCSKKITVYHLSPEEVELGQLQNLMSGTFSSKAQAEVDSSFFSINLVMYPIWEDDRAAKWLYVEQAATANLRKPYRQRIYKLTKSDAVTYESKVYELPEPEKFIHGWEDKYEFASLKKSSLIERVGCSVFLKKDAEGCYSGSTDSNKCKSSLRGASYASSIVTVCKNEISSWDQGWDTNDTQVWGSENGAYIFDRIDED